MEKLYKSNTGYAQAYAVLRLAQEIEAVGGKLKPWRETSLISIDDPEKNKTHPPFETPWSTWSGWQINFELADHDYELWGDSNPFFPVYLVKKPLGDKRKRYAKEFRPFGFHIGAETYVDNNPEFGTTEMILIHLLLAKTTKLVEERK